MTKLETEDRIAVDLAKRITEKLQNEMVAVFDLVDHDRSLCSKISAAVAVTTMSDLVAGIALINHATSDEQVNKGIDMLTASARKRAIGHITELRKLMADGKDSEAIMAILKAAGQNGVK